MPEQLTDSESTPPPYPKPPVSSAGGSGLGLVDTRENWQADPLRAFVLWQAAAPKSTRDVRYSMWKCFYTWLRNRDGAPVALGVCESSHVTEFLDDREVRKGQRYRYILLIESVWRRLEALGMRAVNPGSLAAKKGATGEGTNDPTTFLTESEREQLERFMRGALADAAVLLRPGRGVSEEEWVALRNLTITALMLGAGLKVAEAKRLSVSCSALPREVAEAIRNGEHLDTGRNFAFDVAVTDAKKPEARKARMLPIARLAWPLWWDLRIQLGHGDGPLFRAEVGQRLNQHRPKTVSMHPVTIYKRVREIMLAAGIAEGGDPARICPQTLRNTYAAQLMSGAAASLDDLSLAAEMGFKTRASAARLRLAHEAWLRLQPDGKAGRP